MATTESFNDMLKEYMPYELLVEEMKRRNYLWNKLKKDENWYGGTLYVPFEGAEYSSLSLGSLTGDTDIAEMDPIKGSVTDYPELWGTMIFNEKDLDLHGDLKYSFLKSLPGKINQFIMRMSERLSLMLLNGAAIDTLQTDGDTAGVGILDILHPERFTIGEKLFIDDDDSAAAAVYVINVDINNSRITVAATRGGVAASQAAYTTAQNAKLYLPGAQTAGNRFSSLRDALLSSANGGSATLYGETKTDYPYLQALNLDGSSVTAANILDKTFDYFMDVVKLGKGNPTEILCSMTNFANMAKVLEVSRRFVKVDQASGYGFRKISVIGAEGSMDITGIRDMEDDVMFLMDWSALKFHGSHFFDRKRHLDYNEYYLKRATSGYQYIVDVRLFGDLVVSAPSYCGVVHTISY